MASKPTRRPITTSISIADVASWYCAIALVSLIFLSSFRDEYFLTHEPFRGNYKQLVNRACDEIYIVGEGETLHTISDKCGDPFIVEQNPHIHDPDDVFPGLVIKITPSKSTKFYALS
ncbi:unnamed protein product [Ilex paraguariensis]|uniref:LysM domain-containing protein n=1 Tax=Ilex paraguariensis TaxID=185542 RepID=A0ABC8RML2_9AQUA